MDPLSFDLSLSRRRILQMMGAGATVPLLAACGGGNSGAGAGSGAADVTGGFAWDKAKGTTIKILQTPHVYQQTFQPMIKDFTELTGIEVVTDLVPEADYFTKLNTELAGGSGTHDAFMMGAYWVWQYGPPGWLEDLDPWLQNASATADEFDHEDIFEGLRTSMKWDFKIGTQAGTGGTYAMPWGFEINNIAYNKTEFDKRGIKPAETYDDLIQLAIDLTDRSQNRYGIAYRGSKSWATIHPGFMTQYAREGGVDYELKEGKLVAVMNSPIATDFTWKWAEMAKAAGPTSWTTYEYPNVTTDLGDGTAMMVYEADSATYPKNLPGASKMAGQLGWHPGPAGPTGSYATNVWTWCYGMNAKSKNKLAAWLFMQWASGKEAMNKAVQSGAFADPVRQSVFNTTFKQTLGDFPGYLESFERQVPEAKVLFTPQTRFLETTEDWAVALQSIYGGADAQSTLDALAQSNTTKVNS